MGTNVSIIWKTMKCKEQGQRKVIWNPISHSLNPVEVCIWLVKHVWLRSKQHTSVKIPGSVKCYLICISNHVNICFWWLYNSSNSLVINIHFDIEIKFLEVDRELNLVGADWHKMLNDSFENVFYVELRKTTCSAFGIFFREQKYFLRTVRTKV